MTKSGEAKGIAQFIDATWGQIVKDLNFPSDASPFDVKYAIPAQAYYLSQQFKNAQSALAAGKVQGIHMNSCLQAIMPGSEMY